MTVSMDLDCLKCGAKMQGPLLVRALCVERLKFSCRCGYMMSYTRHHRRDVEASVQDLQTFVDETTSPEHPVRVEWARARAWILTLLQNRPEEA